MALTWEQLAALAAGKVPADQIDTAVAIALAESGGQPGAVSSTGDYGLWQINHQAHPGYSTSRLLSDSTYNAAAMAAISKGGTDWSAWSTWWKDPVARTGPGEGPYKKFLTGTKGGGVTPGVIVDKASEGIAGALGAAVEPFLQGLRRLTLIGVAVAAGFGLVVLGAWRGVKAGG